MNSTFSKYDQSISENNYSINSYRNNNSYHKKGCSKKIKVILVICGVVIVGLTITIIAIVLSRKHKSDQNENLKPGNEEIEKTDETDDETNKNEEPNEEESDDDNPNKEPINIEISYIKDELRLFDIEKNITSRIYKESDNETQETMMKYICAFGIKNNTGISMENSQIYQGFFAILGQTIYNTTTKKYYQIRNNTELINIIYNKTSASLLRNLQETKGSRIRITQQMDDSQSEKEKVDPFLKLEFYSNGSYKNILRPEELSDEAYNEMKEFLDIIIPKITNDTFKNKAQTNRSIYLREKRAKMMESKKRLFKLRRIDENEDEEYEISVNSTTGMEEDKFDVGYEFSDDTDFDENEINVDENNTIKNIKGNKKQINMHTKKIAYSENTKFRGSNTDSNVSTILDSNNTVKEIFVQTHVNLENQQFLAKTDKDIYDSNNVLKEKNFLENETNINISNNTKIKKENTNITGAIYNMSDANKFYSIISQHIIVNISYYNKEIIKEIYQNYLDKFSYKNDSNSSLRMLKSLKNIIPIKDLNKYEIVELNPKNVRKLEEEENKKYYGLKKISHRKDVFQSDLLGLDIILGLTNTYIPETGRSSVAFKMNLGDYKVKHEIKSYKTNQPIITENIQQMSFKLMQMMYLTHETFGEKNEEYQQKINPYIKDILQYNYFNMDINDRYSYIKGYYDLISNNRDIFEIEFNNFKNNLTKINDEFIKNSENFNNNEMTLKNYLNNYINNIIGIISSRLEKINEIISEIKEEINNEDNINYNYLQVEDFNSIIENIQSYLKKDLEESLIYQINKNKNNLVNKIEEKIKNIENLNQINNLEYLFENNKIIDSLSSNKEKEDILSELQNIKNIIENIIPESINSLKNIYENKLSEIKIDITQILPYIPEVIDNKYNDSIINDSYINDLLKEYLNNSGEIDESINQIIVQYINQSTDILSNLSNYLYNNINNYSINVGNKMLELGKLIKSTLNNIKLNKKKAFNDKNNSYFEDNMFNFYEITNEKNELLSNKKGKELSSFDKNFLNSIRKIIETYSLEQIDYNFNLTYEYFTEGKDVIDNCMINNEEEDCSIDYYWNYFFNSFKACGCEFYLNIDFINRLTSMSSDSYIKVINNLNSAKLLNIIENYYNSFEGYIKELNLSFNINEELKDNDFSYLQNINLNMNLNFDSIKNSLKNDWDFLKNYGLEKQKNFTEIFNIYFDKKEGIIKNDNCDIKIGDYLSLNSYILKNRNNYLYVTDSTERISLHVEDDKTILSNNLVEKLNKFKIYYENYYKNLFERLEKDSFENDEEIINLYSTVEKYYSEINKFLNNITNEQFINDIFNEFEDRLINSNNFTEKIYYLSEVMKNFSKINDELFFNSENENISDKYEILKYIDYSRNISYENFFSFINKIINSKIDIIEDLNQKIIDYIIFKLDEEQIKNESIFVMNKFNEIKILINNSRIQCQNIFDKMKNISKEDLNILNLMKKDENKYNDEYHETELITQTDITENFYYDTEKIIKFIKEIKIKKELHKMLKIISYNKLKINKNENIISDIDIKNIDLYYDKIKLNIIKDTENVLNNFIKPEINPLLKNYTFEIIDGTNKYIKGKNLNEIIHDFKELFPQIDGNFSMEIEKELNILFNKFFYLIGLNINSNYKESEINFKNVNKTYYIKIIDIIRNANIITDDNETEINDSQKSISEILFGLIIKNKEKLNDNIKSYLNKFYGKFEIMTNNFNLYEEYKKDELSSSLLDIYKEIINNTSEIKSININKTKPSAEEIQSIIINSYYYNLKNFQKKFVYNDYLYNPKNINSSEYISKFISTESFNEKINKVLNEIKNVIEKALHESKSNKFGGYFMNKYIINILVQKINSNSEYIIENDEFYGFVEQNLVKMEYLKLKFEKLYYDKIKKVLQENFKVSLSGIYNNYLTILYDKYKINYNYYISMMINYNEKICVNRLNQIKSLENKNYKFDYYSFTNLLHLKYSLNNTFIKNTKDLNYNIPNFNEILAKSFLDGIFNEKFMQEISLSNDFKNIYYYSNITYNFYQNYSYSINSDGLSYHNDINNLYKNIANKIDLIIEKYAYRFNEIIYSLDYNLPEVMLDKLINQYYYLKNENYMNFDEKLFNSIIEEFSNIYKTKNIDKIIEEYSYFSKYLNKELETLINDEIKVLKRINDNNSYYSISNITYEIIELKKEYTQYFLNEINEYNDKLKIFGMIDGLISIPLDKAEKLRDIWDYSPNIRRLEESKKKKINFKKINKYYYKTDKRDRKIILNQMNEIMKQNPHLRNLEEYNYKNIFNSTSVPLSFGNISDIISILVDDIYFFKDILLNDEDLILLKNSYNSFKSKIFNNIDLIELNSELFNNELYSFSKFNNELNYNYTKNIYNNIKHNSSEQMLLKEMTKFLAIIENDEYYKTFQETLIGLISSIYLLNYNLINSESKIIKTDDNNKYKEFMKNINNINDNTLELLKSKNIFENSNNLIENNLIPKSKEIKNDAFDSILNTFSNILSTIDINFEIDVNTNNYNYHNKKEKEEDDDEDELGELSLKFYINNKEFGKEICYEIDVIDLINNFLNADEDSSEYENIIKKSIKDFKDPFSIKIPLASFPFLQIRIIPKVTFSICTKLNYQFKNNKNNPTSIMSFDFNIGSKISLSIEGGLYLNIIIFKASIAVGITGNIFDGKIGLKLDIDFNEARIKLGVYFDIYGISFVFYLEIKIKIFFFFSKTFRPIDYKISIPGGRVDFNIIEINLYDEYNKNNKNYLL